MRSLASAALRSWLPLTTRLARAFAARLHDLPATTRTALLVAALNDSTSLSEVLAASALLAGPDLNIDALVPAVLAQPLSDTFFFVTGYGTAHLPSLFRRRPVVEKPVSLDRLKAMIDQLLP